MIFLLKNITVYANKLKIYRNLPVLHVLQKIITFSVCTSLNRFTHHGAVPHTSSSPQIPNWVLMLAQSEVPLVPLGEHIYNKRPEVGKQTFFFKSANQKSANYKQTGSVNHKFATCKIYGRTANKTNYISPRISDLQFEELIWGLPTFASVGGFAKPLPAVFERRLIITDRNRESDDFWCQPLDFPQHFLLRY